jgi:succinate-semialdehyde dehydrogenase/glutarate-semialdehyde dehydrogenase
VLLVRALLDAGLPPGLVALVHGPGSTVGEWLLTDQVPAMYAFTGSTEVGERIHSVVGLRRTQLELGSLSSTIVCADANLEVALDKIVGAGFRKAGQVCTSVQRVYLARPVVDRFVEGLVARLASRKAGDPTDPATFVGPLISPSAARRVLSWVDEAVAGGALAVAGGSRDGSVVSPTVLVDVDPAMRVMREEVFGPVVCVRPFDDLDAAVAEANQTPYGLAAGIFTRDIDGALTAARRLRMGSVHINETSSSRVDLMPYSGVKRSGMGREGPRYAVAEMTEERLITLDGADGEAGNLG